VLVKVTMNLKISICSYRPQHLLTSGGTVWWKHPVSSHSPQPSAIYMWLRTSSVPVKANC